MAKENTLRLFNHDVVVLDLISYSLMSIDPLNLESETGALESEMVALGIDERKKKRKLGVNPDSIGKSKRGLREGKNGRPKKE